MPDSHTNEDWEPVPEDLRTRRLAGRAMGGGERLAKHRAAGKLDARARVHYLLDPGSFQELGTLVGGEEAPADAVVIGSGRVDNRPVMVAAEDFTVKAGTISQPANSKRYRVAELAVLDRVPWVMMLEGAGARAARARPAPGSCASPRRTARTVPDTRGVSDVGCNGAPPLDAHRSPGRSSLSGCCRSGGARVALVSPRPHVLPGWTEGGRAN